MPLVFDVLVGGGARDGEADDEDVGLRVRKCPQPVVLFLTGRVPQVQTDNPAVHRHLNAPHTHPDEPLKP